MPSVLYALSLSNYNQDEKFTLSFIERNPGPSTTLINTSINMNEKKLPRNENEADSILQELVGVFMMQQMSKSPEKDFIENLQTVIASYISAYNKKHNTQCTVRDIWPILKNECSPGLRIVKVTEMNLDFLEEEIKK